MLITAVHRDIIVLSVSGVTLVEMGVRRLRSVQITPDNREPALIPGDFPGGSDSHEPEGALYGAFVELVKTTPGACSLASVDFPPTRFMTLAE